MQKSQELGVRKVEMTEYNRGLCAALCSVMVILSPFTAVFAQEKGPVTNLNMPRFVSLKAAKANARRGPSLSHKIDWIYKQKHMPLEIYGEYENWRRVRDIDGAGGWIHYSLLSGVRTAIVTVQMQPMTSRPDGSSLVVAQFEKGAVAEVEKCQIDWCQLLADGYKGWVPKEAIWGVYPNETKE